MTRTIEDLPPPALGALLEALEFAGVGVMVGADRGKGLERWYANEHAALLLGYSLEEFADISPLDTIVPEQRPLIAQMVAAFRAGQAVPPALEMTVLHKQGKHIAVEMSVGHFAVTDGIAFVVVIGDASSHRSQLTLLEADRIGLVGALSAGFAHETNNPLTSVLLNLRSLRKQLMAHLPDAARTQALRCLDDITTGAERIASNVRALQTLATRSSTQQIDLAATAIILSGRTGAAIAAGDPLGSHW